MSRVRWDDLFNDLAGQFDAGLEEEARRAAIDEERLRVTRLTLRDRLASLDAALEPGERIGLQLHTGERLDLIPAEFGADWFGADLVGTVARFSTCFVPLAGISSVILSRDQIDRSLTPIEERPGSIAGRLGFGVPLRDLARRRSRCEITTNSGVVFGTIDRVARDHLDVAMHDPDASRRQGEVLAFRLIPIAEITLVRVRVD